MLTIRKRLTALVWNDLRRACGSIPSKELPGTQQKKVKLYNHEETLVKLHKSFQTDNQNEFVVPIFKKSLLYGDQIAVKDAVGEYTYLQLYISAKKLATQVSNICSSAACKHVACLCSNSILSTLAQWGCWMSGQVVVPLNTEYPPEMLKYLIQDSQAQLMIACSQYEIEADTLAAELQLPLLIIDHSFLPPPVDFDASMKRLVLAANERVLIEGTLHNDFYNESNALLIYTSGTSRKPMGVLHTHKSMDAQIRSLIDAWQISCSDSLLHALPLNHMHGCYSAFLCPLSVGGKLIMHEDFNSHNVWSTMLGINAPAKERANVFLGIPAIYSLLIGEYDKIFAKDSRMVEYIENYCRKNFRLMACASAPLTDTIFQRWHEITGHKILHSYSTTETGIALSNPYVEHDQNQRSLNVGSPLPGIKLRLEGENNKIVMICPEVPADSSTEATPFATATTTDDKERGKSKRTNCSDIAIGELHIAGANVFKGYFNRAELITAEQFDGEYFKTGDIVSFENGVFEILGSCNVDVIEIEGHKVCSLEIESLLITHPSIKDVAVLGIPDSMLGERIGVFCVLKPETSLDLNALKSFCSQLLPTYKHPTAMQIVEDLPREGSTKINKLQLIKMYFNCKNKL